MTWTTLPVWGVIAGVLGLAGALFLLQRLRVRHRRMEVITTLFWREAIEDSRARVLVRRFRHPWAYALIVTLASLIWLAFSGPKAAQEDPSRWYLLLDRSANMTQAGKLERAKEQIQEQLKSLPIDARFVYALGSDTRLVLSPGEQNPLFVERTRDLQAELAPSALEAFLRDHFKNASEDTPTKILVFGDSGISEEVQKLKPEFVELHQKPLELAGASLTSNHGIVACGMNEAISGAFDRVDVLITLKGPQSETLPLSVKLGEADQSLANATRTQNGDESEILIQNLPTTGEWLQVSIEDPDGLPFDNQVNLRLPLREKIKVSAVGIQNETLLKVLEADPAIELVTSDPQVILRVGAPSEATQVPTLSLVPKDSEAHAFTALQPEASSTAPSQNISNLVQELALDRVDGAQLAESTGSVVSFGIKSSSVKELRVWQDLTESSAFQSSQAFPLFFSQGIRWLRGLPPLLSYSKAGEILPLESEYPLKSDGIQLSGIGSSFTPPRAGRYTNSQSEEIEVLLTNRKLSELNAPQEGTQDSKTEMTPTHNTPYYSYLIIGALLLLALEWWFVRRGRMP